MSKALIFDFASDFCSAALADVGLGQLHEKRWGKAFTCAEVPDEKDKLVEFIAVKLNELSKVNVDINDLSALAIVINNRLIPAQPEIVKQLLSNQNVTKFLNIKSPNCIQLFTRRDCKAACLNVSSYAKDIQPCVHLFDINGTKMFVEKYERDNTGKYVFKDFIPMEAANNKKIYYQSFVGKFKEIIKLDKKLTNSYLLKDFIIQIKDKTHLSSDNADDIELKFPLKEIPKAVKKQLGAAKIEFEAESKKFNLTKLDIMQAYEEIFYNAKIDYWNGLPPDSGHYATVGALAGSGTVMRNSLRNAVGTASVDVFEDKIPAFGGTNFRNVILQGANEILNSLFLCAVQPFNGEQIQIIAPFSSAEGEEGGKFYYDLPITLSDKYTYDEFGSLSFNVGGRLFAIANADNYHFGSRLGPYFVFEENQGYEDLQSGYPTDVELQSGCSTNMALRIVGGKDITVYLLYGPNLKNKFKLGEVL